MSKKEKYYFAELSSSSFFNKKIEARVESATISDRLGPNDWTSDGEKGAGFKEGRQRRQRLCARDHGREQQYEFSFSILNIWRLSHEKMIYIWCCRPTKKNLWDPRKPSWGGSFICSGFQGRHKFESFRVKRFFPLLRQMFFVRFCANMITLSVAGFYKAFGQSFISDDHFLSLVGAVSGIQYTIQMLWECSTHIFVTLGQ